MILEKTDRLRLMADTPSEPLIGPEFLITNNADTEDDQAMLDTALETVKRSSKGPALLWDKFTANAGYSEVLHQRTKENLATFYANRRLNSFGFVTTPEQCPQGFKTIVIMPDLTDTLYGREENLRRSVIWAGVLDNGTLLQGRYSPSKPVMAAQHAFQEIRDSLFAGDGKAFYTSMTGLSLDGNTNKHKWTKTSGRKTQTVLQMATLEPEASEFAQTGNGRIPEISERQKGMSEFERYVDTPLNKSDIPESPERTAAMNREEFREQYTGHIWKVAHITGNNLKGKEINTMWKCMRALESVLDPDALKAARIAHLPTSTHYNWLNGATLNALEPRVPLLPDNRYKDTPIKTDVATATRVDPEMAKRRKQAVRLFPVLAREWMETSVSDADTKELFGIIDDGKELVPYLAAKHHVTQRHIKAIRGLSWQMTGNQDCRRDTNSFLRMLPLDRMPKNRKEWASFRKTLTFMRDLHDLPQAIKNTHSTESYTVYTMNTAVYDPRKGWGHLKHTDPAATLATGGPYQSDNTGSHPKTPTPPKAGVSLWEDMAPRYHAISKSLGDYPTGGVRDMLQYIEKHLVEPTMKAETYTTLFASGSYTENEAIAATEHLYKGNFNGGKKSAGAILQLAHHWSLRDIAEAQNRWHRNITVLNDQIQDPSLPSAHEQWTPVLGTIDLGKGLVARELCSAEQLHRQGALEDHCVGGYTPQVLSNRPDTKNTLIFSIEQTDAAGHTKILSTVDIKVIHDEKGIKTSINQNYGRKNSTPTAPAIAAGQKVARMLKRATKEQFGEHFQSVAAAPQKHKMIHLHGDVTNTIPEGWIRGGFDPRNTQRLEIAFQALQPMLPKSIKTLDDLKNIIAPRETPQGVATIIAQNAETIKKHEELHARMANIGRAR